MKSIDLIILDLQKQRKDLRKAQQDGRNHNGYRDAENLLQAIISLEKAKHLIKLSQD
jgi:hypothetical protein